MPIKIISFNIWDLPLWFVENRQQRVKKIARFLKQTNADIICLQESFDVSNRQFLHNFLGKRSYHATAGMYKKRRVPTGLLDTTGGLIIFSKYPIIRQRFMPFKRMNYSAIEFFSKKGVLEAIIQTPKGRIQIINTHLLNTDQKFLSKKIRSRQIAEIIKNIAANQTMPTILAGDLNQDAAMDQSYISKYLSKQNLEHPGPDPLLPSYRPANPLVSGQWLNKNWLPWKKNSAAAKRLDYIFVRFIDKIGLKVKTYRPIYLKPTLSDHDPVVMILNDKH